MWDKKHSKVKPEQEVEIIRKKKSNTKRVSKRKAGETFKKNIAKICEEKDNVEIALLRNLRKK